MAWLVQAENLRKVYTLAKGDLPVLKNASLQVAAGETVAIVGKSGAGKSTLMHVLGGLDRPDGGRVAIAGQNVYSLTEKARSVLRAHTIGFVFQSYHLLPEMDVTENVMLPAMALSSGAGQAAMRQRARELLAAVELGDRADHTPMELSGGEQQRAAVARALMNDPQLILADEPTGNLDTTTGGHVLDMLFALVKSRRRTLVMVTHNEQVARMCGRVFKLQDGALVAG